MAASKEDQDKSDKGAAAIAAAEAAKEFKGDVAGATKFKDDQEAQIKVLLEEAEGMSGKEQKKAKKEKEKAAHALKNDDKYVDACRVLKGLPPNKGNFADGGGGAAAPKAAAAPSAGYAEPAPAKEEEKKEKKEDKKPKKAADAGIGPDERKELEKLKADIIAKKKELKDSGLTGGAINKSPEIVTMVNRMNELKEKECPGSSQSLTDKKKEEKKGGKKGSLSIEELAEFDKLKGEIEVYKDKLVRECGYTKKEVNADPDLQDMLKKMKDFEKRGA